MRIRVYALLVPLLACACERPDPFCPEGATAMGDEQHRYCVRSDDESVRQGPEEKWHRATGAKPVKLLERTYADNKPIGVWREWSQEGVLLEEAHYADGERHGPYKKRSSDGGLVEGAFVAGKKHGLWRTKGPDGKPVEEANYKGDKRHGGYVAYGSDGTETEKGTYETGLRTGEWSRPIAFGDHRLRVVSTLKAGVPVGRGQVFDASSGEKVDLKTLIAAPDGPVEVKDVDGDVGVWLRGPAEPALGTSSPRRVLGLHGDEVSDRAAQLVGRCDRPSAKAETTVQSTSAVALL